MSEYWKSTPKYWCKFCSQYVRDTNIERKNHEASARHQNNIQRGLRELHKTKEREERDKQRAKDEVARLNGLVDGKGNVTDHGKKASSPAGAGARSLQAAAPPVPTAASRRAQAEQLAAMGVELPEELRREVTGVGSYQVLNAREAEAAETVTVNRSLAEILAETRREEQELEQEQKKEAPATDELKDRSISESSHKRKADSDDDIRDEEAAPKRKAWGSNVKSYPGVKSDTEQLDSLDALLSTVKKEAKVDAVKKEAQDQDHVKTEVDAEAKPLSAVPDINAATDSTPAVVFKKRKGKK